MFTKLNNKKMEIKKKSLGENLRNYQSKNLLIINLITFSYVFICKMDDGNEG